MCAVNLVDMFFKQHEFKDNPSVIAKYSKRATRNDGPALWKVLSAKGSNPHDIDYIVSQNLPYGDASLISMYTCYKPQGLFELQFMVEFLTWAIKKPIEHSKLTEYGHPKGVVALAVAVVCNNR